MGSTYSYLSVERSRPTSRDMVERFCDTHFERFGRREHSLLRVFHKLFGLLGDRLDLIACVLCRKFHKLGGRLHSLQPLHKVKRGVGVCVSELQKLVIEVLHTLKRGRRTGFDDIGCLGRRGAHVLESFSRLRGALFRHLTKCSRGVCFRGTSGSSCGPGHVHKALVLRAFSIYAGRDALSAGPMSVFANGALISGAPTQWLGMEPHIVIKSPDAMNCVEGTQKVIAAGYSRYCLRQHELMR
jgi:hypothetical protein